MEGKIDREAAIRNSALWAAYADALGFITELADEPRLRQRIGRPGAVAQTVPWRGQVGGRFGASVEFPVGTYSDDTQLRLATCRAIRSDGTFDVEPFATIELPVWLIYALGAGRGTRAAAESLCKRSTSWCTNFFRTKRASYLDSGGNGAAMRIQPHVWAARPFADSTAVLGPIIRNALITHGHPRGFLGAALHGLWLRQVLRSGEIPAPGEWADVLADLQDVPRVLRADSELAAVWIPIWEEQVGGSLEDACATATEQISQQINVAAKGLGSGKGLETIARELGCFAPATRGAGDTTSVFALCVSWAHRENPAEAVAFAANLLGTDTDSIGTMAGALLGSTVTDGPPGRVLDVDYIIHEACRMHQVGENLPVENFDYPDVLTWRMPNARNEVVTRSGDGLLVSGLGRAEAVGEAIVSRRDDGGIWQWLRLEWGQTILAKARVQAMRVPERSRESHMSTSTRTGPESSSDRAPTGQPLTIDEATEVAIKSGFDERTVGSLLLGLSTGPDGVEKAIGFAAVIAKARLARARRTGSPNSKA